MRRTKMYCRGELERKLGRKLNRLLRRIDYYLRKLTFRSSNYTTNLWVKKANKETIEFIKTTDSKLIAEIGVFKGHTAMKFAEYLKGRGELHLFDFEDMVSNVEKMLNDAGYFNVLSHGNSRKTMDSYNWSLMKLLQAQKEPMFDYVYLDGAHVWAVDALTFFLVDRLLKPGGYIDFDDYDWTLESSPSMNPNSFPPTKEMFTQEQIETRQVALIIELLVRRDPKYVEVIQNKIFRKM
jgi:predicted O-methyltransferase YrrM